MRPASENEQPPRPVLKLGGWIAAFGSALLIWALWLGASHFLAWLHWGVWPDYSTGQLWSDIGGRAPQSNWVGIQRALNWWMEVSAGWTLFWFGMGVIFLGGHVMGEQEKEDKENMAKFQERVRERERLKSEAARQHNP